MIIFFARQREIFFLGAFLVFFGGFFSRVSAKKNFGVFLVFFGVFFCCSRVSAKIFWGLFFQLSQAKPGIPALTTKQLRGCVASRRL